MAVNVTKRLWEIGGIVDVLEHGRTRMQGQMFNEEEGRKLAVVKREAEPKRGMKSNPAEATHIPAPVAAAPDGSDRAAVSIDFAAPADTVQGASLHPLAQSSRGLIDRLRPTAYGSS